MDAIQCSVVGPATKVVIHGAFLVQVLGQSGPLAPCAEDTHHAVFSVVHMPAVSSSPAAVIQSQTIPETQDVFGRTPRHIHSAAPTKVQTAMSHVVHSISKHTDAVLSLNGE